MLEDTRGSLTDESPTYQEGGHHLIDEKQGLCRTAKPAASRHLRHQTERRFGSGAASFPSAPI